MPRMNAISRGIRNAFRNATRTVSVIVILGLSIALALSMLLAHQAVNKKIDDVKGSVGNTITIAPAGFNNFSQANNALTTSQLDKVKSLNHVSGLTETLTDRLTTIGSSQLSFGQNASSSASDNQTSLKSPVTLNSNGNGSFSGSAGGGGRFFISGGGNLPTNFSLPITIVGTDSPNQLNGAALTLSSGQFIDGSKDTNDAMISTDMASKNNLKVGSTFTAYNATLTVAGIFKSDTRGGGDNVIVSLPAEQRLSGQSGDVTSATATVDSVDNLSAVTSAIKDKLGSSVDVTNDQTEVNDEVSSLQNIKTISLYSLIGAVIAGAVIIFLVMLMIVRERRREIGVFKAIGATNLKVVSQFMVEAVTLTVLAAVVGIIISVAAANPITNALVSNSDSSSNSTSANIGLPNGFRPGGGSAGTQTFSGKGNFVGRGRGLGRLRNNLTNIHAIVSWSIVLYGLAAAVVIALVGSAIASWSIAKVRPAEVLRTE